MSEVRPVEIEAGAGGEELDDLLPRTCSITLEDPGRAGVLSGGVLERRTDDERVTVERNGVAEGIPARQRGRSEASDLARSAQIDVRGSLREDPRQSGRSEHEQDR